MTKISNKNNMKTLCQKCFGNHCFQRIKKKNSLSEIKKKIKLVRNVSEFFDNRKCVKYNSRKVAIFLVVTLRLSLEQP
ncbi:hypothetical protein HanIR_Chr17g0892181 [Helianthus annuus]|nr:hypothetical protein HanIR_Chr17g0892181 [Helianthus annuus]